MSLSDPGSVVRIAIALAALKHKPRNQSTASYLLDLQARFSIVSKDNDGRDWRTYAFELEKQLAALTAQRDADQELLSKLRSDASQATSTDGPPLKKKSKKNTIKDQHDLEWSWDQSRSDWSHVLSSQYPASPSLVAVYASLKCALNAPNTDLFSYASRLADATLRALETMHVFLFSPPCPIPTQATHHKPEHIDSNRVELMSPLLLYVLRIALPALVCTVHDSSKSKRQRQRQQKEHPTCPDHNDLYTHLDRVIDRILECILLPLLRAFVPLCSARLAPLLIPAPVLKKDKEKNGKNVGKSKDKDKDKDKHASSVSTSASAPTVSKADVRTDVFALIGMSLEALDALPPSQTVRDASPSASSIARSIRDRLGLETIRELEALYAVPSLPSSVHPSSEQAAGGTPGPSDPSPPLSTPTSLSAQSRCSQSQPQPPRQQYQRAATAEFRAKRLERFAGTRAERVRALATRDAGWFLASTLNLCVVSSAPAPAPAVGRHPAATTWRAEDGGKLLREALLDRIGGLIRSVPSAPSGCVSDGTVEVQLPPSSGQDPHGEVDHRASASVVESKLAISPVCQNMLLAICERAVCQLAS
ncbi:hypothetical protein JVU11DRAFT_8997 [Chiua virens]|nr:hypothetical protein JVU11DRAFT_8997 [Chiua virens]